MGSVDSCQPKVSEFHMVKASPARSRGPGLSPRPKKWETSDLAFVTVKPLGEKEIGRASLWRMWPARSEMVRRRSGVTETRRAVVVKPSGWGVTGMWAVREVGRTAQEASSAGWPAG